MTAIHSGDGDITTERAELLLVEDFVFGIEAENNAHRFACFAQLASEHIHGWNTYTTAHKQWFVACLREVVAIAENGQYVKLGADWQATHRLSTYAYYLIYNSKDTVVDIANRDGSAEELTLYADIHELPRKYACGVAAKLHTIDVLGYLFVGFYFKC